MKKLTGLLYARPSFTEGFARLIDFGGTLQEYNYALNADRADFLALASDWDMVGDDLRTAVNRYDLLLLQEADNLIAEAKAAILAEM